VTHRQKHFAASLVAVSGIVAAALLWRVSAVGDSTSDDISPEITISETQDEPNLELKTPPTAEGQQLDTRSRSGRASTLDATAEPSAQNHVEIAETTAENIEQEEGENGSVGGHPLSPLQSGSLTANGGSAPRTGPAGSVGGGFGMGAGPLGGSAGGSNSIAGGSIPQETAHTARAGGRTPSDSSLPTASSAGSRQPSDDPALLFTDEDFAGALSAGDGGTGDGGKAGSSDSAVLPAVLETTFAEESSSSLAPPAPPLRANPEPASLLLLATGLGLAARQLQRRAKSSRQA
jgi:hypothetical protein